MVNIQVLPKIVQIICLFFSFLRINSGLYELHMKLNFVAIFQQEEKTLNADPSTSAVFQYCNNKSFGHVFGT